MNVGANHKPNGFLLERRTLCCASELTIRVNGQGERLSAHTHLC